MSGAPEEIYARLLDPAVLAGCIPGCQRLVSAGDGRYDMKMKVVLAAISGDFAGSIVIEDPRPAAGYVIVVEGNGRVGFLKGSGKLDLAESDEGTVVAYDGEVQTGGTIASVGQRLLDTTAKLLIKRFFEKFAKAGSAQ